MFIAITGDSQAVRRPGIRLLEVWVGEASRRRCRSSTSVGSWPNEFSRLRPIATYSGAERFSIMITQLPHCSAVHHGSVSVGIAGEGLQVCGFECQAIQ